jgi:hypothetical protein
MPAESRPPHRNTGIPNERVKKEVEDSVPGEAARGEPEVPLEARYRADEEPARHQRDSIVTADGEPPRTANKM